MQKIDAPWTQDVADALNRYQKNGMMHPFTCGGDHPEHRNLIATRSGWICEEPGCNYRQYWAHDFMAKF